MNKESEKAYQAKVKLASIQHAITIMGQDQATRNPLAVDSISNDFMAGVRWAVKDYENAPLRIKSKLTPDQADKLARTILEAQDGNKTSRIWIFDPASQDDMDELPIITLTHDQADVNALPGEVLTYALDEGAQLWKQKYDDARALLQELDFIKHVKDTDGKTFEYEQRRALIWPKIREFLSKYQHLSGE